jgi:hypothetical protein
VGALVGSSISLVTAVAMFWLLYTVLPISGTLLLRDVHAEREPSFDGVEEGLDLFGWRRR